jgi:hypothetical protein
LPLQAVSIWAENIARPLGERGRVDTVFRLVRGGAAVKPHVLAVLYAVTMAAVILGVDFAFFRNRFWERLTVNLGIVLVFASFYLRFFRRP